MKSKVNNATYALILINLCVAFGLAQLSNGSLRAQFFATFGLIAISLASLLSVSRSSRFSCLSFRSVLVIASSMAVGLFFSQPLLEDDHFRYLWDGFITATTGRPYVYAPSYFFDAPAIPAQLHAALSGVNHPDLTTVYGPVWQAVFACAYWISPGALWPLKLFLLVSLIALLLLLRQQGISNRWCLVFCLHPLVVKESMNSAHPDLLIGIALLTATLLWQRTHAIAAAVLVCLAVGMKISALAVLPFFLFTPAGRLSAPTCGAVLVALSAILFPQFSANSSEGAQGLRALGEHWVFNPLIYRPIAALFGSSTARVIVAIGFCATWIAIAIIWIVGRRSGKYSATQGPPPVVPIFIAMFLFAPVVNPWYWLWILPLAVLQFSLATWVGASVSLLAYTHLLDALRNQSLISTFVVPFWATTLQIAALCGAMLITYTQYRRAHALTATNHAFALRL